MSEKSEGRIVFNKVTITADQVEINSEKAASAWKVVTDKAEPVSFSGTSLGSIELRITC